MTSPLKPITIADLSRHFVKTYKLTEIQSEKMVKSSARSIAESLEKCERSLDSGAMGLLTDAAHNLKGLLLNMGREDWAEIARKLEAVSRDAAPEECRKLLSCLKEGSRELIHFHQQEGELR